MAAPQVMVCTDKPVANSTERPPIITACELLYWSKYVKSGLALEDGTALYAVPNESVPEPWYSCTATTLSEPVGPAK